MKGTSGDNEAEATDEETHTQARGPQTLGESRKEKQAQRDSQSDSEHRHTDTRTHTHTGTQTHTHLNTPLYLACQGTTKNVSCICAMQTARQLTIEAVADADAEADVESQPSLELLQFTG